MLLVGGFFAWRYFSSYESTDDAQIDGHLMPLSARISGYIVKVNVDDNQYVEGGQFSPKWTRATSRSPSKRPGRAADAEATAHSSNIDVPVLP